MKEKIKKIINEILREVEKYVYFSFKIIVLVIAFYILTGFLAWAFLMIFKKDIALNDFILLITAAFILIYTRETQAMKEEARKQRYLENLPIIKLLRMEKRKNKKSPLDYMGDPGVQTKELKETIKKHTEHYAIEYENVGKGIAFIKSVTLWVGNPQPDHKLDLNEWSYKKTLYSREKDEVIYPDTTSPLDVFPKKIEIVYEDMLNHEIIYRAVKRSQTVAESLPFLGIRDYIEHTYDYPESLK